MTAQTIATPETGRKRKQPLCSVTGCHRPQNATSLCQTHYMRLRRHGSLSLKGDYHPIATRLVERAFPEPTSGCWLWTGRVNESGYGTFTIAGRSFRAHRLSYEHFVGPIPPGASICHRCDTPICISPLHLFAADHATNMRDMARKGRAFKGIRLTPEDRSAIRRLLASQQATASDLAAQYGVTPTSILNVARGKTWRLDGTPVPGIPAPQLPAGGGEGEMSEDNPKLRL